MSMFYHQYMEDMVKPMREELTSIGFKELRTPEEVEDALPVQICHDADVVSEIEAVPEVDASVDVVLVVGGQCRQHAQFYATSVPVFWH